MLADRLAVSPTLNRICDDSLVGSCFSTLELVMRWLAVNIDAPNTGKCANPASPLSPPVSLCRAIASSHEFFDVCSGVSSCLSSVNVYFSSNTESTADGEMINYSLPEDEEILGLRTYTEQLSRWSAESALQDSPGAPVKEADGWGRASTVLSIHMSKSAMLLGRLDVAVAPAIAVQVRVLRLQLHTARMLQLREAQAAAAPTTLTSNDDDSTDDDDVIVYRHEHCVAGEGLRSHNNH